MKKYLPLVTAFLLSLQGCLMNEDVSPSSSSPYTDEELYFSKPEDLYLAIQDIDSYKNDCDSNNNAPACVATGIYFVDAQKDYQSAQAYFLKACNLRDDLGCQNLGYMYGKGIGVEVDYNLAKIMYEMACELSEGYYCFSLALLYENGHGVRQDFNKSYELFLKGCSVDDFAGCFGLGGAYEFGRGVRQDFKKAKEAYGRSCDLKHQLGCDAYRRLNEQGH